MRVSACLKELSHNFFKVDENVIELAVFYKELWDRFLAGANIFQLVVI